MKRKTRDHDNMQGNKKRKVSSSKTLKSKSKKNNNDVERRKIDSDDANDVYEYEETIPEEESMKNRRFDHVENFEYELPKEFKVNLQIICSL